VLILVKELTGVIEGLSALKGSNYYIELYTDSKYVQKGVTLWLNKWVANNWKTTSKKPVKNRDLWEKVDVLNKKHKVTWYWVKGHSNDLLNDKADHLAKKGLTLQKSYSKTFIKQDLK